MCISPVVKASEGFNCRRCATDRLALEAGRHELLITARDRDVCAEPRRPGAERHGTVPSDVG